MGRKLTYKRRSPTPTSRLGLRAATTIFAELPAVFVRRRLSLMTSVAILDGLFEVYADDPAYDALRAAVCQLCDVDTCPSASMFGRALSLYKTHVLAGRRLIRKRIKGLATLWAFEDLLGTAKPIETESENDSMRYEAVTKRVQFSEVDSERLAQLSAILQKQSPRRLTDSAVIRKAIVLALGLVSNGNEKAT